MTDADGAPARTAAERAGDALAGCRVGDALGESFFFGEREVAVARVAGRRLPPTPRRGYFAWTDDTLQSASVHAVLVAHAGSLPQDALAAHLADRLEPGRGYGGNARQLLLAVREGASWRQEAASSFGGAGSYGNGAAMRVAPVGAWHAGDPDRAAELARAQSEVTHAHHEAADGAAAVAAVTSVLAAAPVGAAPSARELLDLAADHAGEGRVRSGLVRAGGLLDAPLVQVVDQLGTGWEVAAYDTVPFALWAAVQAPHRFAATFWRTVAGLGDRDTTCAIACAVVAAHVGRAAIPASWDALVEPLPSWVDDPALDG